MESLADKDSTEEITGLLNRWQAGDTGAEERLLALIYPQLRALANRRLSAKKRSLTLETAELVHETYLKLVDQRSVHWQNRAHFYAIAARLMRRIVVDRARRRGREKRGGGDHPVTFDELSMATEEGMDWLVLDECLSELAREDSLAVRIVELRFFIGLTSQETAKSLSVSESTVARSWRFARAWLQRRLEDNSEAHRRTGREFVQ